MFDLIVAIGVAAVGWAKARSAVPTDDRACRLMVGPLRFAHPTKFTPEGH